MPSALTRLLAVGALALAGVSLLGSGPAPAQGGDTGAATATQVVQQTDGSTLPATGLPVGLLAGTGALLLMAGTTLRRRTS